MNRHRFILLLIVALVAIGGALFVTRQRDAPPGTPGVPLLPALADAKNTVTSVAIRKASASATVTMHQVGAQWSVAERADYPADVAKLRKLLTSLRDARIVEEKTSDPARFSVIGVEDPATAGAAGAEVSVTSSAGKEAVIVGKPVGNGNFVRRVGENRTYSVEPSITLETEPQYWIDERLVDVPVVLIQGIEIKPAAGPAYALHRLKPGDNAFTLDGVPPGRKALDGPALAPAQSFLAGLNAEDVAPAGSIDFASSSQATVTLTDAKLITIIGTVIADKHWIELKSDKDGGSAAKTGRAFEIASYRYDAIFKPLEQLLEPKAPPAPPKALHALPKAPPAPPKARPVHPKA